MEKNEIVNTSQMKAGTLEKVLVGGDLAELNPAERIQYYKAVCDSIGLNPLTKPFEYIRLNNKLTLYALKSATEQLRHNQKISLTISNRETVEGVYIVTARATMPDSRTDESTGAVSIEGLKGEAKANAFMKAETKAKRRVTLSICGLGMLDETEVETIPGARPERDVSPEPKEIPEPKPENGNGKHPMSPYPAGIAAIESAHKTGNLERLTKLKDNVLKSQNITSEQQADLLKRIDDAAKSIIDKAEKNGGEV